MTRVDKRSPSDLREVSIEANFTEYAEGSALISFGNTRVLCNATIEESVPPWMRDAAVPRGWVTGEYAMLPRSTHTRTRRELSGRKGRTHEICRLIGRSLRAAVDLEKLGPRSIIIDCDVLQADGGTRTAAITGGYVALRLAIETLISAGEVPREALTTPVAAVSVGMVGGTPVVDLCYQEDVSAESDLNIVMNGEGEFIEVQGTAEAAPFSRDNLDDLLNLASEAIVTLLKQQAAVFQS